MLFPNRKYYVLVDDGAFVAFEDCAGLRSPVDGISDKNRWMFRAGQLMLAVIERAERLLYQPKVASL